MKKTSTAFSSVIAVLLLISSIAPADAAGQERPRARDIGIIVGEFSPGPNNAITDVAGVRVDLDDAAPGLHRLVRLPRAGQALGDDPVGRSEHRVDVARGRIGAVSSANQR